MRKQIDVLNFKNKLNIIILYESNMKFTQKKKCCVDYHNYFCKTTS